MEQKRSYFLKKYGVFPEFTVGMQQSEVVAAFLGDIKKQLDLSGDLMNTASRICGICSDLKQEILMPQPVYEDLNPKASNTKVFDNISLHGKSESLRVRPCWVA